MNGEIRKEFKRGSEVWKSLPAWLRDPYGLAPPSEVFISGNTYSICLRDHEIDKMVSLTNYLGVNEEPVLRIALTGLYEETMAEMENHGT